MCCCLWFVTCGCCSHLVGVHQWDIKYLHYLLFVFLSWLLFVIYLPILVGISSLLPLCKLQVQTVHCVFVLGYNLTTLNSKKLYVFQNILFLCFYLLFCLCVVFLLFVVLSFVSMNFFLMIFFFLVAHIYIIVSFSFCIIFKWMISDCTLYIAHHTCKCL